ncbi:hypothetical protein GCK32_019488, partial [Trichostrongylus colubriformis]
FQGTARIPRHGNLYNSDYKYSPLSESASQTNPRRSLAGRSSPSVSPPPQSYNSTTFSSPLTHSFNVSRIATGISSSFDYSDESLRSSATQHHSTDWPSGESRDHSECSRNPSETSHRLERARASAGSPNSHRSYCSDRRFFRRQESDTG